MSKQIDDLRKAMTIGKLAVEVLQKSHVKQHSRTGKTGAVTQVSAYDDKRQNAAEATNRAERNQGKHNWNDPRDTRVIAADHSEAAFAHVEALKHAKTNDAINHHLHAASRHLQANESMHSFADSQTQPKVPLRNQSSRKANPGDGRPLTVSNFAKEISDHANGAADSESTSEGLNKKASLHMLAMEQHHRAQAAYMKAATQSIGNKEQSDTYMHYAQCHADAAMKHGKEVRRLSGISVDATNKAYSASEKANRSGKPGDHKAAAEAHHKAAKLNYDSEGAADHARKAKEHEEKAKPTDNHPQIIGKATAMDDADASKASTFQHDGKRYLSTGKQGTSLHDDRPVREFESPDGHRTWLDHHGNVHADSKEEAQQYRKEGMYAEHDDE